MILRQLEVQILTAEGIPILDARVTASREGGGQEAEAKLDLDRSLHFFEGLYPGFYRLEVKHVGSEEQSRRVQVHPKPTREIFILSAPGTPQIRRGKAVVPYGPVREKLWFRPKPQTGEPEVSDLLSNLHLARETEPGFRELQQEVFAKRLRPEGDRDLLQLRESPHVEAAGPVVRRDSDNPGLFTRRLAVRFRPETTRQEIDRVLGDQHLEIVKPLDSSAGLFVVQAPASTGEEEINTIATNLSDDKAVAFAEPILLQRVVLDCPSPNPFLWPGAWDRHRTRIEPAWQRLENEKGEPKRGGDPDVIIAVVDTGIRTVGGVPENPDFQQTVTSGEPKVYQVFDFNQGRADNDGVKDSHGASCAGVATGRSLGVAPNCRLMGLIPDSLDPVARKEMLSWAAGLAKQGPPDPIQRGADIFSVSIGLDVGPLAPELMKEALEFLTRRGRSGKGCLIFLSAGNEPKDIAVSRPLGVSGHAFSCAASTIVQNAEGRTGYSGFGEVEWCAPSSSEASGMPHRPPIQFGVSTASLNAHCIIASTPWVTTYLSAKATKGEKSIFVESTKGFVPLAHLTLGRPGQTGSETIGIVTVPGNPTGLVKVKEDGLFYEHAIGTEVTVGLRFMTQVTTKVGAASLPVASFNGLKPGAVLMLWDGSPGTTPEFLRVPSPTNDTAPTVSVAELTPVPSAATRVFFHDYYHIDSFGGTSAAAAHCAGIGALVLSANPRLTWIEAREILRTTAEKIAPDDPGWLDSDGRPTQKSKMPPVFNPYFGYGRLNAEAAVAAALSYHCPRDLMIRKTLNDTGDRRVRSALNSPDIWVRRQDPLKDLDAKPQDFQTPGPHEAPYYGSNENWVYARISNRGSKPSFEAWVRFYIASGLKAPFSQPDDWEPLNGTGNITKERWGVGTYFIGEVGINAVAPGQDTIVNIHWPAALLPPPETADGRPWRPFLLVEITPFDGPRDAKGREIQNNRAGKSIRILSAE